MKKYSITGMNCASCQTRIEKTVNKISGVKSCSVSLLTNSMLVEGNFDTNNIIKQVTNIGYGICENNNNINENDLKDSQIKNNFIKLSISIFLLLILMYFSMGQTMFNLPVPTFLKNNVMGLGLIQLLLNIAIILINKKYFINGFKAIINGSPNMDTLIFLGSGISFIYSVYILFILSYAITNGLPTDQIMYNLHFETSSMILTFISIGKTLETLSKGKTTDALKNLIKLSPQNAYCIIDGIEKFIPIENVKLNDIFIVRSGEYIPVDGVIIDGNCVIDESSLTGESLPIDKTINDNVYSGTINKSGFIKCRATKVGQDTSLNQIIKLVSEAQSTKAPIAKTADKISAIFIPLVLSISFITFIAWLLINKDFTYALDRAISVIVISCPCALGLATPVAIIVGNGKGAKNGILFKTAESQEETGKIKIVVLDKTGTITKGDPIVTDIIPYNINSDELLKIAYSLEMKSEHPLAKAIVKKAKELNLSHYEINNFKPFVGNGLIGKIENDTIGGGNFNFINSKITLDSLVKQEYEKLSKEGKTPLLFTKNNYLIGIIAVADTIKDDAIQTIEELKNMGLYTVMLTGDNHITANAIGNQIKIDKVYANLLPNQKENIVKQLKKYGKVAMVGDGINDAIALTRADIGIAIGAGTDIAIDSADIVLMNSKLRDIPALIKLSKATIINIYENLFWASIYNIIGIPLASGLLLPIFNLELNPMFSAGAMSLSSLFVVLNALRLNLINIYKKSKIHKHKFDIKILEKEINKIMKKEIIVDGMMCPHCEASVKKALEKISGVTVEAISFELGNIIISLENNVDNNIVQKSIEDRDYKVISISDL